MRHLRALVIAGLVGACATTSPPEPAPYLATYRPLEAKPGEMIVYPTAALDGRLDVVGGCFVVVSDAGGVSLVAFTPQVSVVRRNGRWGLRDDKENQSVFQGDRIGIGGSSMSDTESFFATRLQSPRPPATCPRTLFLSNSGFGTR